MSKFIGLSLAIGMLSAVLVPSLASAQTPGNGLLSVYVQVINNYGTTSYDASNFSVQVFGNNPSPSTFFGSINGTQVSLGTGTYNVTLANNQYSYSPSYSQGCTGTIAAGQTSLCVVTVSATNSYSSYPTPYPYGYNNYPPLTCVASTATVGLLQNVSFTAQGGQGGTYNWTTPEQNYPNVGPTLTVSFANTGTQLVSVTNANQSANCEVTVNNTYYPVSNVYPTYPTTPTYPVSIYTTTYPRFPNTGFAPITAGQVALALALLAGVAVLSAPYVRKAFVIVSN